MPTFDLDADRFQFSLSRMMLSVVPVAVMTAVVTYCIRSGVWFPVVPSVLIGVPSAVGAIGWGRKGFGWGLLAGSVVSGYLYIVFVFVVIVYVLCTTR